MTNVFKRKNRLGDRIVSIALVVAMIFTILPLEYRAVDAESSDSGYNEKGFSTTDGSYQPAEKITAENYKDYDFTAENWSAFEGYYAIENAGQLYWFADKVNNDNDNYGSANAVLTKDIKDNDDVTIENTSSLRQWVPIGCYIYTVTGVTQKNVYFSGVFDGNNHTISGLYFYSSSQDCVGLFGQITSSAVIKNLGVINSSITGEDFVAGVCGSNKGKITNCYNKSYVKGVTYVSGVCGQNEGTTENCYNTGTITGSGSYVGGICGWNYSKITNCYNTGNVTGGSTVGGVSGRNYNGTIENCYNEGTINGGNYTAGVCGINDGSNCKIINCYNTGNVTGTGDNYSVGGVCGQNDGTITNCYNTGVITGNDDYDGGVSGYNTGKITSCYNIGTVNGKGIDVGGVSGYNKGTITNCYNTGDVTGEDRYVGGLCGINEGTITNCYNSSTVKQSSDYIVGGVCAYNSSSGTIINCYFDSVKYTKYAIYFGGGTNSKVESKKTSAFESGEVVYLLSQGCTIGEGDDQVTYDGSVWGQNLDAEGKVKDTLPNFTGAKVYFGTNCKGDEVYSNSNVSNSSHKYNDKGFCEVCDAYQSAEKITAENYKDYDFTAENWSTYEGYYAIENAGQLYWFAIQVNSGYTSYNAVLTKDIKDNDDVTIEDTSSLRQWTPIGNDSYNYKGIFDGNGHTISGLYFNNTEQGCVGLFGYNGGTIKNLGVINSSFTASNKIGGVCGKNEGTIEKCYNTGVVTGSSYYVGGVCGHNQNGKIINCYNQGNVSGVSEVGGVSGRNDKTITNCYSTGNVTGNGNFVGGVCGYNEDGTIKYCYFDKEKCSKNAIDYGNGINVNGKVTSAFESGEVAYLLQNTQDDQTTTVWGQNIDNDKTKQDYPVLGGAKVYQTTLSDGENYTNNSELLAKVAGYTLTLDGSIGVNFYMSLADKIITNEDAYVKFTYDNKTQIVKVSEATKTDDGYYVFTCDVAAAEMTMDITAQLFSGDYKSAEYKFTVQDYAKYILNNSSDFENSATLVPLVKAMLNYGANAQKYFNKNTDKPANSILDESDTTLSDITAGNLKTDYEPALITDDAVGKFTSYYLNLSSETSIKVKFTPTSGVDMSQVKFYIGEDEVTDYTTLSDGKVLIVKSNIDAFNLGTKYTFKAVYTDNDGNSSVSSVTVSALSYVYTVLKATSVDEKLVNTMIALYDYNSKALGYTNN